MLFQKALLEGLLCANNTKTTHYHADGSAALAQTRHKGSHTATKRSLIGGVRRMGQVMMTCFFLCGTSTGYSIYINFLWYKPNSKKKKKYETFDPTRVSPWAASHVAASGGQLLKNGLSTPFPQEGRSVHCDRSLPAYPRPPSSSPRLWS